ncbi:Coiled-coil domain containing protein 172 [Dissostichus eleginoides]|uniref:Coiled-coil domain-containing protein 172 n=1 Tax=Dissostichus eleginoides TaxID=100907 RepID=A0AAD9CQA1_DISEL|nr:Coiled-coil domain containing protein 172 [Dissostichus eleginoides]
MSLDTLFEQILVTEQQLTEQTQRIKEVKVAIIRYNEKIKSANEKNEKTNEELETKAQQLSAMRLQRDLMKKSEVQMLKQIQELLGQKSRLTEQLAKIKWECKVEEKNFLEEISRFNGDFSLCKNKAVVSEKQTNTEMLNLQREEDALNTEMDLMSRRNRHMSSLQEEKRVLLLKVQSLKNVQKELDLQLSEAEAMTESLRAEQLFVSQKPFTDNTCLRLRQELQMHEEGELKLLREALGSEIHVLKSKLDSSQESKPR